ncbi:porin family protein [Tamlana sp. I1]|uniref:porin family protein n=1 Tax=Tamlana sp. I1 TaxID=2762061 RepID=UPI001E43CFB7|nr:porin family protein [Tamlana sp. I1]
MCFAQETSTTQVDSLYKEDQFYAGATYNFINKRPEGLSQNGFSFGFSVGFIKDMPINKARNKAIGVGLGYATDSYNQNLFISKNSDGDFVYSILSDGSSYSKNKIRFHLIEMPIEYRWRTSTPTDYAFWRIYTGFKFAYAISNTYAYKGELGAFKYRNNRDFNNFQCGLTLSAGYNTWNIHVNYLLNSILSKKAHLSGENIDISIIKIGLIFYVL